MTHSYLTDEDWAHLEIIVERVVQEHTMAWYKRVKRWIVWHYDHLKSKFKRWRMSRRANKIPTQEEFEAVATDDESALEYVK